MSKVRALLPIIGRDSRTFLYGDVVIAIVDSDSSLRVIKGHINSVPEVTQEGLSADEVVVWGGEAFNCHADDEDDAHSKKFEINDRRLLTVEDATFLRSGRHCLNQWFGKAYSSDEVEVILGGLKALKLPELLPA